MRYNASDVVNDSLACPLPRVDCALLEERYGREYRPRRIAAHRGASRENTNLLYSFLTSKRRVASFGVIRRVHFTACNRPSIPYSRNVFKVESHRRRFPSFRLPFHFRLSVVFILFVSCSCQGLTTKRKIPVFYRYFPVSLGNLYRNRGTRIPVYHYLPVSLPVNILLQRFFSFVLFATYNFYKLCAHCAQQRTYP